MRRSMGMNPCGSVGLGSELDEIVFAGLDREHVKEILHASQALDRFEKPRHPFQNLG